MIDSHGTLHCSDIIESISHMIHTINCNFEDLQLGPINILTKYIRQVFNDCNMIIVIF